MPTTCCAWCWRIVEVDRLPNKDEETVCSDKCAEYERWFRYNFSDEKLGLRMYERYGVNPNHRGKRKKPQT